MRMWMVNPKNLCRKHLLGEHNEIHKLIGSLKRKRSISGYIKNDCLEPLSMEIRHNQLVQEMKSRGYNHKSPLPDNINELISYLPETEINHKVNTKKSLIDLKERCTMCNL